MPIPPHLPQLQYGYDDGFTTIIFGLLGSFLGCILILLISFLDLNFKSKTPSLNFYFGHIYKTKKNCSINFLQE